MHNIGESWSLEGHIGSCLGTITETGCESSLSFIVCLFVEQLHLLLAVGLHCYAGSPLVAARGSHPLVVVSGLLIVVASLCVAPKL